MRVRLQFAGLQKPAHASRIEFNPMKQNKVTLKSSQAERKKDMIRFIDQGLQQPGTMGAPCGNRACVNRRQSLSRPKLSGVILATGMKHSGAAGDATLALSTAELSLQHH
jgi:hypothetical protein